MMSGNANNTELTIFVTHYNQYDPRLSLQHYSAEVLVGSKVGAPLVSVEGADDDAVHYNRRLRYFLADPNVHFYLDPFLEPPRWSPVAVDQDSGGVSVSGDLRLNTSPLQLLVGVVDAGSPQRYSLANLTIYVRNISAPRGVKVVHTTESTLKVCWSPPTHGRPQGYVLTYTPSLAHSNYGQGSLNLSISQLRSKIIGGSSREEEAVGKNEGVVGGVAGGVVEIYRYCAIVGGLARWTEYIVGVRAWAVEQVSIAAVPVLATTRSDYCGEGVCGTGGCTLRQSTPGYICHCQPGYYGLNCQHHNPCLPHNPCQHFGKCQNATDGSYTCDCPRGFYGDNCTQINPCEAVTSNPCNNGGTCVSEESGRYRCVCTEGFYGMTCEHYDPCVSNPCQHGGSCTNLSHTSFSCHCAPGYRGKLCQAEVNECFPSPCARGHCVDLVNDYYCQCPQGWGGKLCGEDLDECASYPCMNGATCIDGVASFVCDCAYGYNGEHCDIPESCPAQHTLLDAGDFYWPATQHGTSVTLACPFGVRASARDNISTGNTTTLPGAYTTTLTTTNNNKNSRYNKYDVTWYEDGSPRSTPAPLSLSLTTHAQWKGGSFRISRRTRNVEIPASAYNTSPSSPVSEVNDHDARRRLIVSNLRASPQGRPGQKTTTTRKRRKRRG
ncbi:uncharacterized protein LOC121879364 [Homarus americanus]|uniref:uncharacterized protein LOC121879364 n=1 Tax=Homarus americanus TaxID=6706 RepID=UPI001C4958E1|nr:uncharacterized protein LOC121879364 [Homarus americanus]